MNSGVIGTMSVGRGGWLGAGIAPGTGGAAIDAEAAGDVAAAPI